MDKDWLKGLEDGQYTITCSIAYLANSTDLPIPKEPWMHVRLVSITKVEDKPDANGRKPFKVAWYACTYIWDTREVVDWHDITGIQRGSLRYAHAIDNGKRLKDPKGLVPKWAQDKLIRNNVGR